MTPDEVLQRFAEQCVTGALPLDEATSVLADWVARHAHQLTSRDLALLYAVGGAIFDSAIALRLRESRFAGIAADGLIDLIRRRE